MSLHSTAKNHEPTDKNELAAPKGEVLVYQAEDGQIKVNVRLEDESVWLTQAMMADLFQTTQQNVSLHILNVLEESELTQDATHKEYLSVRREGNRDVRQVPAQVCSQCGESWLSGSTSTGLKKIVDGIRQKHSMVEVLNWQDVVRLAA